MIFKNDFTITPWIIDVILTIEESEPQTKNTFMIGSVRELGKTTGLIQIIRHLGSKQKPDMHGVRRLKFFMLRSAYRELSQLVESYREWFDLVPNFAKVERGEQYGFACKDMRQAPKMVFCEPTPDIVSLMFGEPYYHDGTTTVVEIECYSYGHIGADSTIRGANKGSGMLNEAQTIPQEAYEVSRGTFGRPRGKVEYPCLFLDFNMPKASDVGYEWLKLMHRQDPDMVKGENVHIIDMEPPYKFERHDDGDFTLQGRKGYLIENPDFLSAFPHIPDFESYSGYRLNGDDSVLRDMLGKFGLSSGTNIIYHEFDPLTHLKEISPPDPEEFEDNIIIVGMDFGFTPAVLFSYVDQGIPYIFKEIAINDINFYQLLETFFIPYLEKELPYYYDNDQIVIVGDPTSGSRRDAIKSATPVNVLLGITDINGDEMGDATRYKFNAVPSPCGNQYQHRINITKQLLSKPNGCYFDPSLAQTMTMFEEYCESPSAGKPIKKSGVLYHGMADTFQYITAYLHAGYETHVPERKTQKKRKKRRKGVRYV